MRDLEVFNFIKAREAVRIKKESGMPAPWTTDKILATYRFCNMHRENDRVTKDVARLLRRDGEPDIWFVMVIARLLNKTSSLEVLGYPLPWNPEMFLEKMQAIKGTVFNAAYIISTLGKRGNKLANLSEFMLTPMWEKRESIRPRPEDALESFHARLMLFPGMGSFMAGQVVGDTKFCDQYLKHAVDWWTWAPSGPGSRRGLSRVFERDLTAPWNEIVWLAHLTELKKAIDAHLLSAPNTNIAPISAQDLQNCLCEFDKYERVRLGEGRPKQFYKPGISF